MNIYSENSQDESNNPHRTATYRKIITRNYEQITTPVVNIGTTEEPQESDINVIKGQLQS